MKKLLLLISLLLATVANAEIFQPEDYVKLQFPGCFEEHKFTKSNFKNDLTNSTEIKLSNREKSRIQRVGKNLSSQLRSIRNSFDKGNYEKVIDKSKNALELISTQNINLFDSPTGLQVSLVSGHNINILDFYLIALVEIPYLNYLSSKNLGLDMNIQEKWLNETFTNSRAIFENKGCSTTLSKFTEVEVTKRRYKYICKMIKPYEAHIASEKGILEYKKKNYKDAMSFFSLALTNYNSTGFKKEAKDTIIFERMNLQARNAFAAEKIENWCIASEGYRRATELAKFVEIEPLPIWGDRLLLTKSNLTSDTVHEWEPKWGIVNRGKRPIAINKIPPVYPRRAMELREEGCVMLEFTVNQKGKTEDVRIIWSTNGRFNTAAVRAAKGFEYRPYMNQGKTERVAGILNQITFIIDDPRKGRGYIPAGCE